MNLQVAAEVIAACLYLHVCHCSDILQSFVYIFSYLLSVHHLSMRAVIGDEYICHVRELTR